MSFKFQVSGFKFLPVLLLFAAARAHAQVTISCKLDPSYAAQYEAVHGVVTLRNDTGQELELFTTNGTCEVAFEVHDQDEMGLADTSTQFLSRPVRLAPTESLTITNNILDFYDLRKVGSYKVYGRATWNGKTFMSERAFLDIVPGMELARVDAGLPGGGSRTYTLRMVNRDRFDRLLIRIDDESAGVCYGVYDLGSWVHTEDPVLKVDGAGNVHVLYQSGPIQYVHRVFSPDGGDIEARSFNEAGSKVRLETTASGQIQVAGSSTPPPDKTPAPQQP